MTRYVRWSVCLNFLKERKVILQCSYLSTCLLVCWSIFLPENNVEGVGREGETVAPEVDDVSERGASLDVVAGAPAVIAVGYALRQSGKHYINIRNQQEIRSEN